MGREGKGREGSIWRRRSHGAEGAEGAEGVRGLRARQQKRKQVSKNLGSLHALPSLQRSWNIIDRDLMYDIVCCPILPISRHKITSHVDWYDTLGNTRHHLFMFISQTHSYISSTNQHIARVDPSKTRQRKSPHMHIHRTWCDSISPLHVKFSLVYGYSRQYVTS